MICVSLRNRIHNWLRDYVRLQSVVVILIYAQIGCALIGSLGALYNGVLLINLAIALFGIVAIESNSQNLGRTYAVLLFCSILLDVSWFIIFSKEIWNISSEMYQAFYIFSVKLTMAMEIAGFVLRLSASLLWFQIYRLGASIIDTSFPRQSDSDLQNSFLEPPLLARQRSRDPELRNSFFESPPIAEQFSRSDKSLGDFVDEPASYTPLFDGGQSNITTPNVTQKPFEISLLYPDPWRHLIPVSVDSTYIDCDRKIAFDSSNFIQPSIRPFFVLHIVGENYDA